MIFKVLGLFLKLHAVLNGEIFRMSFITCSIIKGCFSPNRFVAGLYCLNTEQSVFLKLQLFDAKLQFLKSVVQTLLSSVSLDLSLFLSLYFGTIMHALKEI